MGKQEQEWRRRYMEHDKQTKTKNVTKTQNRSTVNLMPSSLVLFSLLVVSIVMRVILLLVMLLCVSSDS